MHQDPARLPAVTGPLFAIALTVLCCAADARADEPAKESTLPPVTVRAAPLSPAQAQAQEARETLDKVPGGTNLIDLDEFQGSQASVARVLEFEPGIVIQEFFGGNDQPRVNVRGSGIQDNPVSRGIQLLYDGLPLNQADGSFIIGLLDPELARQVSVYRGANALRFGATTLGGAIDFGLRNARNSPASQATLEAGSYGLRKGSAALAGAGEAWDLLLRVADSRADGWRAHSEAQRSSLALNAGLRDGALENRTLLLYTRNRFDAPFLLTKHRALTDPRSVMGDYVGLPPDEGGLFEQFLNVRVRDPHRDTEQLRLSSRTTLFGEAATHVLGVYAERVDDTFRNPATEVRTAATNAGLDYAVDGAPRLWGERATELQGFVSANAGRMPREHHLVSPMDGSLAGNFAKVGQRAANLVIGGQALQPLAPGWQALAAAQWVRNVRDIDDRQRPGLLDSRMRYSAFNPKLGLIFKPGENERWFANLSRSSEAPTFWQLADLGAGSNPGSPNTLYLQAHPLKLQTATTFEIGTQQRSPRLGWEAAYYLSRVRDELIAEVQNYAIDGTTVNYDHPTRHQGVELAFNAATAPGVLMRADRFTLRGIYNWSDFRFRGGRYAGKRIAGVPQHLLFAEGGWWPLPGLFVGLNARWQPKDTPVDHANAGLVQDAYLLLGAKLSWRPNPKAEFFLDLHNLADRKYQTAYVVRGYSPDNSASPLNMPTFIPGPGRSGSAGVTLRW